MYRVIGSNPDGAHTIGSFESFTQAIDTAEEKQRYTDSIGDPFGTRYSVHRNGIKLYRTFPANMGIVGAMRSMCYTEAGMNEV